jgi:hypothetical protein
MVESLRGWKETKSGLSRRVKGRTPALDWNKGPRMESGRHGAEH